MTQNFLDYDYLKKFYKNYDISSYIKKTKKGISVFAKKDIKKGNVVAYYKFKTYNEDTIKKNTQYLMSVYTNRGNFSKKLVGNICTESLDIPKYGIPFWGYLLNEPSEDKAIEKY